MTRVQILLSVLGAILLIVLFWLLLWSPKQDELELVRQDIEAAQMDQQRLTTERNQLRAVRDEAPEVEAHLAAARAVLPADPGLPAALRQLQIAADEANAVLESVSPSRPEQVDGAPEGLSRINISVQLSGGYFQLVDFLRRVEDAAITPRGLAWNDLSLTRQEYPTLGATLSGAMYAQLPAPPPEVPEEDDVPADTDDDDESDVDVDVDVEVEDS
jgi:Tfp pilus assembly protein PilO